MIDGINFVTTPSVRVIAASMYFGDPHHPLPDGGTHSERLGAHAAKVCYDSFGERGRGVRANQRHIVQSRHGSVLQHASVSLHISGISRACSLELNRHSHLAISQRSTRYTDEGTARMVLDPFLAAIYQRYVRGEPVSVLERAMVRRAMTSFRASLNDYVTLVNDLVVHNPNKLSGTDLRKWARGIARQVLPHNLETAGVWTGNFRAWRYVIEERSSVFAEAEIRRLAEAIFNAVRAYAPVYFEDYESEPHDGFPEYLTHNRKV